MQRKWPVFWELCSFLIRLLKIREVAKEYGGKSGGEGRKAQGNFTELKKTNKNKEVANSIAIL